MKETEVKDLCEMLKSYEEQMNELQYQLENQIQYSRELECKMEEANKKNQ